MSTSLEAENGAVEPSQTCPHLFTGGLCLESSRVLEWIEGGAFHHGEELYKPCGECQSCAENWVCLKCGVLGCSRFTNSHMESHWLGSLGGDEHCIALSLTDLSIWCYSCNKYIKHDILVPILTRAEQVKFKMETENTDRLAKAMNRFGTAIALPSAASDAHEHPNTRATWVHPERPLRTQIASKMLEFTAQLAELRTINYGAASREDLLLTHAPEYVDKVLETASSNEDGKVARDMFNAQADLYVNSSSARAILESAGAAISMTRLILTSEVSGISRGFCVTRPPGHHAEKSAAGGFCYLNNTAIAANIALCEFGLDRVMIIDWDIHHGNGNQNLFYDSKKVLHVSIHKQLFHHQGKIVEGSSDGQLEKLGEGEGLGFNINVALGEGDATSEGIGLGDADFKAIFKRIVLPLAKEYQPQLLIIPAGFDAGISDRNLITGGYSVTPACFAELTSLLLKEVPSADGKMLMCLEGGYEPHGVAVAISSCITALVQFDNSHCRFRAKSLTPSTSGGGSDKAEATVFSSSSSSSSCGSGGVAVAEDDSLPRHDQTKVHADTEVCISSLTELLKPHWTCFK